MFLVISFLVFGVGIAMLYINNDDFASIGVILILASIFGGFGLFCCLATASTSLEIVEPDITIVVDNYVICVLDDLILKSENASFVSQATEENVKIEYTIHFNSYGSEYKRVPKLIIVEKSE